MSEDFGAWLAEQLKQRGWSHNELGRRAGLSQTAVSNVISGNRNAGADFCVKVANALGYSPEFVLRLAGILPASSDTEHDPTLDELFELAKNLPPERRRQALDYLRFLLGKD